MIEEPKLQLSDALRRMDLTLPDVPLPDANYLPWKRSGNLVFLAGQTCEWNGDVLYQGKIGEAYTLEQGQQAARLCLLNLLAALNQVIHDDLGLIAQCIQLRGFVNADPQFDRVPSVIDGASDCLINLLGERGQHVRTAVGVATLPSRAAVEVDAVFELTTP